jgi:hypothetical protein
MTRKVLQFQLLVLLLLTWGISGSRPAVADSTQEELGAIRQSILQGVRDDIQRRTKHQRDVGQVGTEPEKPKARLQRAARQPSEKQ